MGIEEKVNIKRLTSVIKKNIIGIIIIVFLSILCGYFYSYNMVTPYYMSTSTILLASNNLNDKDTSVTQTEVTLNKSLISTYGNILKSNKVLDQVINNLELDITRDELYKNIKIEEVNNTQILEISVINENAKEAQKIAEELNKVFIEEIKQIYNMDNITIIDGASLEEEPYNVNHIKDILIFCVVGIVFSAVMVTVLFFFDTTIKVEQDIEEYVDLNVIGSIPNYKEKDELVVYKNGKSIISEALRTIRTNLSFINSDKPSSAMLFTSCNSGEGKSWVAANMAVTYAQSNKNVIIVDADMRKGRQDKIFDIQNSKGLSDCLREIRSNQDFELLEKYIQETKISRIHIMTIGTIPPNPSELLLSKQMNDLLYMLKCVYDVVIIDGTPCNLVSDIIPVSRIVDNTVLIAESRKTQIEDLKNVVKLIKNANGKEIGAILNKKEIKKKEYGNRYYGNAENFVQLDVKKYTVNELILGRKNIVNEEILPEEETKNVDIEKITEKIENLENKLLEISDMNLENNNKLVEEIKKVYESEIDKNKLAEKIKEHVANNEITKNIEGKLEEQLSQLKIDNEIEAVANKLDNIESTINNNSVEENIIEAICKVQNEQNAKLDNLNNTESLQNILEEIREVKREQGIKLEELNSSESLQNILEEIKEIKREQGIKLEELNSSESLQNILEEIKEVKREQGIKLEELNSSESLQNILEEIREVKREQGIKLEELNSSESLQNILEEIREVKREQGIKLEELNSSESLQNILEEIKEVKREQNQARDDLDNSEILDIIITEIDNLNEKITAIENNKIEENIRIMIEQMKQENAQRILEINNTELLSEMMQELKNINAKYDNLVEQIDTLRKEENLEEETFPVPNNLIELKNVKKKLEPKELVIEYGEDIEYENLLDYVVDVYEWESEESNVM